MSTKKKTPKKPAKRRTTLDELATAAVLKACGGDNSPSSLPKLRLIACKAIAWHGYDLTDEAKTSCVALVRDLIASGQIVKVKGVYRRGYIGGPGGEELPEITNPPKVQGDEAELRRCKSVGPKPERFRCGLIAGHKGEHRALIPTAYPWSGVTEADVFSRTVPMTKAQAKVAKRGQR